MLTRVYIDNFRCFVDFEWRPGRRQLIMGGNGSGKSTLMEALLRLRQFIAGRQRVDELYRLQQRTRWLDRPEQTYEIQATIKGVDFVYRLVVEPDPSADVPRFHVASETLHSCGNPLLEFIGGAVRLYNDESALAFNYPASADRSVLANVPSRTGNQKLTTFRDWFIRLYCFRINPFDMSSLAKGEAPFAEVGLSNFAAWYRHLLQSFPRENTAFLDNLRDAIEDLTYLLFEPQGEEASLLSTEFRLENGESVRFAFNELSDGQRCLICLYAILHFLIAKGYTVILDEPDNFLSLREIQPWLMEVTDAVDDGKGQVLLISHHPEIMNQWAPDFGVHFVRQGGSVRVQTFDGAGSGLTPAELVARGWELG